MGTPLMFNVEARNVKQSKNMKAEELKSKIQFESCDVGHNLAMITGKLEVQAVMEYDRRQIEAYRTCDRALDEIKERLREMIMRQIYADQRHELYDALVELFKADPMDYSAMSTAREKILTAAKRQRATESPLAESIAADQRTEGSSSANGSVRSYKLQCAIEWSKMDGYKNETRIEEAYSAQDAVFQASHSLRHWPHTIQSVAPPTKLMCGPKNPERPMRKRHNQATSAQGRHMQRVVGERREKALSDLRQLVAYQMKIPGWNAAARGAVGRMIKEKREALDALLSND